MDGVAAPFCHFLKTTASGFLHSGEEAVGFVYPREIPMSREDLRRGSRHYDVQGISN